MSTDIDTDIDIELDGGPTDAKFRETKSEPKSKRSRKPKQEAAAPVELTLSNGRTLQLESAPVIETALADVAAEGARNASARRSSTWVEPTTRGNGEESVDRGTNDAAIAAMRERGAQQRTAARAAAVQVPQVEVTEPKVQQLRAGNLVAGAAAEGYGVIVGWYGEGQRTRAELAERLTSAQLPSDWLPDAKEPKVQLSRAVNVAAGDQYTMEQEKKRDAQLAETREWTSRWMLVRRTATNAVNDSRVGQRFGEIACVVTLYTDNPQPELVFDEGSEPELVEAIRADFWARIESATYTAGDVSNWLRQLVKTRLDGVRIGGNWYVARPKRELIERLAATLDGWWGCDWLNPPMPVATGEQLASGLARGLTDEVNDELRKLELARDKARSEGKADVTPKAATSMQLRLRTVLERIAAYEALLGDALVARCRDAVKTVMLDLDKLIEGSDLVERFAAVWDEIRLAAKQDGRVIE